MSQSGLIVRMLVCSIAWSSGFLFMKLAGSASPWVLAASRATIATVALSLWFLMRGRSPVMKRRELAPWLVLGTLNGWMPNVLTAYALTQIPAGLSSMIQASGPLMVAVMSHFAFADERLTPRRAGGVLLGFVGMTVLIGPSALQGTNGGLLGVLSMAAVAFSYALGNIYARFIHGFEAERLALGQQTVSATGGLILASLIVGMPAFGQVAEVWPAILALGLLATAIPVTVFMTIVLSAGPTRAAMLGYLMPVWATMQAVAFLGETVGLRELAGAAIILAGVWIVTTGPRGVETKGDPAERG